MPREPTTDNHTTTYSRTLIFLFLHRPHPALDFRCGFRVEEFMVPFFVGARLICRPSFLGSNGRSSGENETVCIWMRYECETRSPRKPIGRPWLLVAVWAYPVRLMNCHVSLPLSLSSLRFKVKIAPRSVREYERISLANTNASLLSGKARSNSMGIVEPQATYRY